MSDPRVAVNLLWCVPGDVGGSEEYTARQLLGLHEIGAPFDVTAWAPRGWAAAHPDVARDTRVVEAAIDGRSRVRRVIAERSWLARQMRGVDLEHHPGGTLPGRSPVPTVLTLHDLQWLAYPEYVSSLKLRYLRAMVPRSLRRASVVATPSEYVRRTVIDAYGIDESRVVVVPHGMERTLGEDATHEADLRRRYALGDGPVLVMPAITHPHKGHLFLLSVLDRCWSDPDLRVVLLGGSGRAAAAVSAAIAALGTPSRVVQPGRVPSSDRDGFIRMATAVVFPSEYEGFGAPVVEAMTLGTPVVSSDRASLPEVIGDAGLVRPLELDAWCHVLDDVVRDRDEFVRRGLQRARDFTTARSGEALAAAYRQALA